MEELWIATNYFNGTISSHVGKMINLTYVSMGPNSFTGAIPSEVGLLTSMTAMRIGHTNVTGYLPTEVGLCTNLSTIAIRDNNLFGTIPSELGLLTKMTTFLGLSNSWTGTLPTELGLWSSFDHHFVLSNSNLTGPIPSEFVSVQLLSFTVSGWFLIKCYSLYHFVLSMQGLLGKAKRMIISNNMLTGNLPTELGNMHGLEWLLLDSNQLSGPIPSELGLLDSNAELVKVVQVPGRVPDDGLRNITSISLHTNDLTGTVPSSLGMLGKLKALDIYNNTWLTGEIPTSLCDLESWPEGGGLKIECELVSCNCSACDCLP